MTVAEIEARAETLARASNPEVVARAVEIVWNRATCSWARLIARYTAERVQLHRMKRRYRQDGTGSWPQIEAVEAGLFHLRHDLYDHPCGSCGSCAKRKTKGASR